MDKILKSIHYKLPIDVQEELDNVYVNEKFEDDEDKEPPPWEPESHKIVDIKNVINDYNDIEKPTKKDKKAFSKYVDDMLYIFYKEKKEKDDKIFTN